MLGIPRAGSHQHHLGGFKIYIPRCQKLQEGDTGTRCDVLIVSQVGDPWILSSSVVALSGIQPDSSLPPATRVTSRPLPHCTGFPHQVFQASDPSLFLLSIGFLLSRSMSIASAWSAGAAYQRSRPYPAPSYPACFPLHLSTEPDGSLRHSSRPPGWLPHTQARNPRPLEFFGMPGNPLTSRQPRPPVPSTAIASFHSYPRSPIPAPTPCTPCAEQVRQGPCPPGAPSLKWETGKQS